MTTGFVLLFAVACLGGVIATVGDRIGMKVGKSRLSLFNLRPRQTATVVSVATGMVASFSTLLLLIALDGQLRKGLFQLDDIQDELAEAQTDLEAARDEKETVESNLNESIELQAEARDRLRETNQSLRTAIAREEETLANLVETQSQLEAVSDQALSLRDEIGGLRSEREALIQEQANVRSQIAQRDQQIEQRNAELAERDSVLAERDQQIAQKDAEIAERESRLAFLQTEQARLDAQIALLEDEYQALRLGNVALARNDLLAVVFTRSDSTDNAQRALERALVDANSTAITRIWPGTDTVDQFGLQFDPDIAGQIVRETADGRDYILRVTAAANYVVGEPCVGDILSGSGEPCIRVNVDALVNEQRFAPGDTIASVQVEAQDLSTEGLNERFSTLLVRSELQARREGLVYASPIVSGGATTIAAFLRQVQDYGQPIEIQTFVNQPIYTLGPVRLDLAAVQNGRVVFRTIGQPSGRETPGQSSPRQDDASERNSRRLDR